MEPFGHCHKVTSLPLVLAQETHKNTPLTQKEKILAKKKEALCFFVHCLLNITCLILIYHDNNQVYCHDVSLDTILCFKAITVVTCVFSK